MVVCSRCKSKFNKKEVLKAHDNKLYCTICIKTVYCTDSECSTSTCICNKFMPHPEMFSYQKAQKSLERKRTSSMTIQSSPLQCPKAECNKFISLFALESHFRYEHKEVAIIFTQLDARSAVEFYPRDVRYNITQCIVLLNVINYDFSNIFRTTSPDHKIKNQTANVKPTIILLSTKIANSSLSHLEEMENNASKGLEEIENDSSSTMTFLEDFSVQRLDDKIMIWLASNVFINLSYTVAASTLSNKTRMKYYGPMWTFGDDPVEICKSGKCLILTHYHINSMTDNGTKRLTLDVVLHSPD